MSGTSRNEKVFDFYPVMPPEIKSMIVDKMIPADRCRFTRCSKLSQKVAKLSKNYIHGLELMVHRANDAFIQINYDNHEINDEDSGCIIQFEEHKGKKYMFQEHSNIKKRGHFWIDELDSSVNLVELAVQHFKQLLKLWHNKIKCLSIHEWLDQRKLDAYDYEIDSLNKIEEIRIGGNISFLPVFSVIRKPLKQVYVSSDGETIQTLKNGHQIYEVQNVLHIPETKLTNEQFVRLSASVVEMPIGDLTEMNICHFIQSWKNGTLGKKEISYLWRIPRDSTFDKNKLFQLLELDSENSQQASTMFEFEVEHSKDAGSCAILRYGDIEDVLEYEDVDEEDVEDDVGKIVGDDDEEDDEDDDEEDDEENNGDSHDEDDEAMDEESDEENDEENGENAMEVVENQQFGKVLLFYFGDDEI